MDYNYVLVNTGYTHRLAEGEYFVQLVETLYDDYDGVYEMKTFAEINSGIEGLETKVVYLNDNDYFYNEKGEFVPERKEYFFDNTKEVMEISQLDHKYINGSICFETNRDLTTVQDWLNEADYCRIYALIDVDKITLPSGKKVAFLQFDTESG